MTTSRLAILLAVMLAGLSSVFLLPKQLGFQPVGIELQLPEYLGEWWGQDMQISQLERDTLGPDTEFARKEYINGRGDRVVASIVLAGQDMMTAIHRPERCLHAQGWEFRPAGASVIALPAVGQLPVTRLHNHRITKTPEGKPVSLENLCFYWFAGSQDLTGSHMERLWIDSRDRLFSGYAQRWAMIMISADITKAHSKFGRDEAATGKLLEGFIAELVPKIHTASLVYR
jgi:EpsI family protein